MSKTTDERRANRSPIPTGYHRVTEAAALTGTSKDTIYQWIKKGLIHTYKHGQLFYVKLDDIEQARQRNRVSTKIPTLPPDDMVTIRRAAATTGAKVRTVQHWAKTGRIKAIKYGPKLWYVNPDDVQHLAETMQPGYPSRK